MEQPTVVTIRFKSARATLCGLHLSGVDYAVSPEFAKQVVDGEGVADYVTAESVSAETDSARTIKRKR